MKNKNQAQKYSQQNSVAFEEVIPILKYYIK
jgi:hypothetical protein